MDITFSVDFNLGDEVKIVVNGQKGMVVGIICQLNAPQYLVQLGDKTVYYYGFELMKWTLDDETKNLKAVA